MTDLLHRPANYVDLIRLAIERYPSRTAFIADRKAISYAEVGDRMGRTAAWYRRHGLVGGTAVAGILSNTPEGWISQAGALLAGCRFTALHPLGSVEDHAYIVDDSEADAIIFDAQYADRASQILARTARQPLAVSVGPSGDAIDIVAAAREEPNGGLASEVEAGDIVHVSYTGGTTGRPKGVVLEHRNRVHNALLSVLEWQWPAVPRFHISTPITHGAGAMIVPVLLQGGTVILEPKFDPERFAQAVGEQAVNSTFMVPTMLYRLLDSAAFDPERLRGLQTVIYGASPISPTRLGQAVAALGQIFVQLYGQTEAPNTVLALRKEDHDLARPELLASCGRPLIGLQVEIHDSAEMSVAPGEIGEICVRGPLVMRGYWNQPDESAHALRGGWLHTGDLARRDSDGYHFIVDRGKDMIISGGFNVYPREVEDVLSTHASVAAACVIGVPDEKWGEAVKAFVVLRPDSTRPQPEELVALVRARKGPIQAPKSIEFLQALPLTSVGKPDKKALREPYWAGETRGVR